MGLEHLALGKTDDLPIRHQELHNGKVRSVYWLTSDDSQRLIAERGYHVKPESQIGVMVISDRISAFDCNWRGEDGLQGIPGKGAALNAISAHWFRLLAKEGVGHNHILDIPHPLVWIVQRAHPIMVEAIARQYITGSMWRAYQRGERNFCGVKLPEGLSKNQRLDSLLITPTTKGILRGVEGIPEADDVPVTREQIVDNFQAFGFRSDEDIATYEHMLRAGFSLISGELQNRGQIFVDTKLEFGYVKGDRDIPTMIYIDEVGTPDSSRMWDASAYEEGRVVENSKEGFRQFLLANLDSEILLRGRIDDRKALAEKYEVPLEQMMQASETYMSMVKRIVGADVPMIENPFGEIIDTLRKYQLLE